MKINNNSFELNEKLSVTIDSSDNDGLVFIPNKVELIVEIENIIKRGINEQKTISSKNIFYFRPK